MSRTMLFFVDDVCALRRRPGTIGQIDRTHGDVDSHGIDPLFEGIPSRHKSVLPSTFRKFLDDGIPPVAHVLVSWQTKPRTELIPEKELLLLDRPLVAGDVVKRDLKSSMSGTVLSSTSKCLLISPCEFREQKSGKVLPAAAQHLDASETQVAWAADGSTLKEVPASELQPVSVPAEQQMILYKNWLGRIQACRDEITIRLFDNSAVVVDRVEELEFLNVRAKRDLYAVGDLVKTRKANLRRGRWIYGAYNPNTTPIGVVVQVRIVDMEVDWLQPKPGIDNGTWHPELTLDLDAIQSGDIHIYDVTQRPRETVLNPSVAVWDHDMALGSRVVFKDLPNACLKYDGSTEQGKIKRLDRVETLGFDMNVFVVAGTTREATVQWHDLSITTERSVDLIPEAGDDEIIVYPGEKVCTRESFGPQQDTEGPFQPAKVGVVQAVNARDRIAQVRWCPDAQVQMLRDDESTLLPSSRMGKVDGPVEDMSLYEIFAPLGLNAQRGDMAFNPEQFYGTTPSDPSDPNSWIGDVVDVSLDGTYTVRLSAASAVRDITLHMDDMHVAVRLDDIEDSLMDSLDEDDMNPEYDSGASDDDFLNVEQDDMQGIFDMPSFLHEHNLEPMDDDVDDEWSTEGSDEEFEDVESHLEAAELEERNAPLDEPPLSSTQAPRTHDVGLSSMHNAPPSYAILDSEVASSHAFATQPATDSPHHLKMAMKEHKILRAPSSLPDGVYVRTWESRMDLLRVLFVGPLDTPYAFAPFVFDLRLPPNYPNEPPQVFFHSWNAEGAGIQGRVNPNLYEDGKCCLSLLGTWGGDREKGEGWIAGKSTVLQVLVSLLGLVLVREPYYNEAGYEPLKDLASSRNSSALYTEQTYLRARAFLVFAISKLSPMASQSSPGIGGLEDVLRWLYLSGEGPHLLDKAVSAGLEILARSQQGGNAATEQVDGLTVISKGACLPLRRVMTRLSELGAGAERPSGP